MSKPLALCSHLQVSSPACVIPFFMKTAQEKLAYLDWVAGHYNLNNRSINIHGACVYYHDKHGGCAIGMKIPDKDLCRKLDGFFNNGDVSGVCNSKVFNLLPADIQLFGSGFLVDLQGLHDNRENWTPDGLSERGKAVYKQIKINHSLQ